MELIYLYLGNINRPLKNQEINFGNKFRVHYDPETRHLTIYRQANAKPCIYGGHIKSLDLLVGKNGTGKSTILDLLGLPPRSRRELLPLSGENEQSNLNTWFVLYHIKDDQFAVEGYHANTLAILVESAMGWHPFYSAAFRYDVENQHASHVKYLQSCRDHEQHERFFYSELFYVLFEPEGKVSWYDKPYKAPESDICVDHICPRIYAGRNGYTAIVKYLYESVHNHEFASKMASKPGTKITIEIFQKDKADFVSCFGETVGDLFDRSSSGRKIAGTKLYHKQDMTLIDSFHLLPPSLRSEADYRFSAKESMVLIYLEELVCHFILQIGVIPPAFQGEDTYSSRKQHLLAALESVSQNDFHLAKKIIAGIEAIPNRYFENNRARATIPVQEMSEKNFLMALTRGLDENLLEGHEVNHRYFVRMSFVGISTGEAQYIDLYATLYQALISSNHPKSDTCVLLLDEPDCGFHPEWSRNFIMNLTELLDTDMFRDYNYQVIISTHSPLMVSDVPKESIHCLQRDNDGSISIKSSKHGFLSNLNDLITDSFFADSIFGAFAEQYVNNLIKDIAVAEDQAEFVPEDQLAELRSRLDRIEDRVIWQSLNWKLCRLEARAR